VRDEDEPGGYTPQAIDGELGHTNSWQNPNHHGSQ
jgi:hypothetical protein